jgi:GTPase
MSQKSSDYIPPTHIAVKPKDTVRFVMLQVINKRTKPADIATDVQELHQLVDTYGGFVQEEMIQRRDKLDPSTYIGPGKIEELQELIERQYEEYEKTNNPADRVSVVVVNDLAKPGQLFRLQKQLWKIDPRIEVWDRLDLILHIFDQHASSAEAQLQIQLARVTHAGPRIYGLGKTELSRQGGGIGGRGKGETNIEFEQRLIKSTQQTIKKKLKKVTRDRHQRMVNRKEDGFGPVALVGYTSAGKTTLFNTLTGKDKTMNRGLFTTLDTVVGKMKSPNLDQPVLISDTIGFIRNLPPILLDSFKSTLLESLESRILLHVIDASDPEIELKIKVVDAILAELKVTQPIWRVFNKIDRISDESLQKLEESGVLEPAESAAKVFRISAHTGQGLESLISAIEQFFE